MASGRSPGGSGPGNRPGQDPYRGLSNLGEGRSRDSGLARGVPNEDGLRALGDQISGRMARPGGRRASAGGRGGGRGGRGVRRGGRPRWSRRRRLVTTLCVLVALILGVIGAGYAYLRYDFGQVTKIACA